MHCALLHCTTCSGDSVPDDCSSNPQLVEVRRFVGSEVEPVPPGRVFGEKVSFSGPFDAPRQFSTLFAASAGKAAGVAGLAACSTTPESPRPEESRLQPMPSQALKKPVSAAPDCPKISRQVYHNQRGR